MELDNSSRPLPLVTLCNAPIISTIREKYSALDFTESFLRKELNNSHINQRLISYSMGGGVEVWKQ